MWFSDDLRLNLHSKELIEATAGKWVIEASDLAGKRKAEIEQLKAMLSRQVDGPARMAYERMTVERPRQHIIIGTTNSPAYLPDSSGGRRFWPLLIRKRFDVAWIIQHRDQLWAEAAAREAQGESIRLPQRLWPVAAERQEQRREMDPWEEIILRTLRSIEPSSSGQRRLATRAIWAALDIKPERQDRQGQLRISDIMQRLGYVKTRVRQPGKDPNGDYWPIEVGFVETGQDGREGVDATSTREPGDEDDDGSDPETPF